MNLDPGARLGPYVIDVRLGAGGMGEVYRAKDSRLHRTVAIKVLGARAATDESLKQRFAREARAISALTDPHICTLFDVGVENGVDYLVMEYCEGVSLAERLRSGLSVEQSMRIGVQLARALERAHAAGVLHRDVKPSNVMITPSGAKLLDFGLAAFVRSADWNGVTAPFATGDQLTGKGEVFGTLGYMAPEALRGAKVDERTDVYSLGVVLYEMLTGQRPFQGRDSVSLIAQIIETRPPSVLAKIPNTPPALDRLIGSCLDKDPDQRPQSAHDVRLQLEWILEGGSSSRVAAASPRSRKAMWVIVGTGLLVAALAAGLLVRFRGTTDEQRPAEAVVSRSVVDLRGAPPLALGRFVPDLGYFSPLIALSHDGKLLVYVGVVDGVTHLVQRRIDSFAAEPIPGTRGAHHAFFSPDDRWIGFFAGDKVMKVPVAGGAPVSLAEVSSPIRGAWRGNEIFVIATIGSGVVRIPENGGAAVTVLRGVGPFISDVLPDRRHFLVRGMNKSSGDFDRTEVLDSETNERILLVDRGYDARFLAPDRLSFIRGGDLYTVSFDVTTFKTGSHPVLIQRGIAVESFWNQAQYAFSASGLLAFVPGDDRSVGQLTWIDRAGRTEALPFAPALYGVVALSPGGKKLAVEVSEVNDTIVAVDLERSAMRRIRTDADSRRPEWMGESRLAYSKRRPADGMLEVVSSDLAGADVRPLHSEKSNFSLLVALAPDGSAMIAQTRSGEGPQMVTQLHRLDRSVPPITLQGGGAAAFSPDGKWLAFIARTPGSGREIMVAPVADPKRLVQVSTGGGGEPLWCRRCPELFYRNGSRWYGVRYTGDRELTFSKPQLLWETDGFIDTQGRSFDVSPDGQRLIFSKKATPEVADRIHLIQNWTSVSGP